MDAAVADARPDRGTSHPGCEDARRGIAQVPCAGWRAELACRPGWPCLHQLALSRERQDLSLGVREERQADRGCRARTSRREPAGPRHRSRFAGLGIRYAYDDEGVGKALARGQLKRILSDWSLTSPGLCLYYSNRRHPQPALRAFIDCLLDRENPTPKRRSGAVATCAPGTRGRSGSSRPGSPP
jgi:DNA-binding transcriptional LysR family regulator